MSTPAPPPRNARQRKLDTLNRPERDVEAWVAKADQQDGMPYMVPLSFLWDGATLFISTLSDSPTGRNLHASGRAASASARPETWSSSRARLAH